MSRSLLMLAALVACDPATEDPQLLPDTYLPPAGVMQLTHSPLTVGEDVTITVRGAAPNTTVFLFRAAEVFPEGFCPPQIAPVCMDVRGGVTMVASLRSNAQGEATTTFRFPNVPLTEVAMQAGYITGNGADTSNAVLAPITQSPQWDPTTPVPTGDPTFIDCPGNVPQPATGVCDVVPGSSDARLLRGTVLGPAATWQDGEVLIDSTGTIACVGCDCSSNPAAANADVVTCGDGVISPGLINAHDHITFSEQAPLPPSSTRYEHRHGWRGSLSTPQNQHGTGFTSAGNRWVEVRNVMAGATTMAGSGAASGMLRNPDRDADEGIDLPDVDYETFPLNDSNEQFRSNCSWNYEWSTSEAASEPLILSHVAEGIDFYASEEFRCQSTLFDGGENLTRPNITHIHGIGLDAVDYSVMAQNQTDLVWSPRSNISLYGFTADVAMYQRLGGVIGLGTDWTYSGSMNILRELACADDYNANHLDGFFTDADLWRMATVNNGVALGAADQIGSLIVGAAGDVSVFAPNPGSPHRAVVAADPEDVALVLRGGDVLYGEDDTVGALAASCDLVNVCGDDKRICTTAEFGTSWASLVSQTPGAYAAFFCSTPTNEPTCVPSRPGEFTGANTAGDRDGDGVANAADNCPEVFNPIRPIDGGAQPDADADGLGDSCDPVPLPSDIDGDGVVNVLDNCPLDAGAQTDGDGDGVGDVCDFCPTLFSADGVCPAQLATIVEVRTVLAPGADVSVEGVVTGLAGFGFTLQDPNVPSGVNAGIFVFTGSNPTVSRGDAVRVEGTIEDYFGDLELIGPTITDLGAGPAVAPVPLTVAQAATEPYESVLVTITSGTVTIPAYDCAVDGNCSDADLWEIGGPTGVVVYDRLYEDADWLTNIGTVPVTGVMGFRWNRRRLMPRDSSDF
jgi:hypothetical protein